MKAMKTPAAKPMPVPAAKVKTARSGYRNGGLVQKSHNPDNHISRQTGYANGGMVGGKKKC